MGFLDDVYIGNEGKIPNLLPPPKQYIIKRSYGEALIKFSLEKITQNGYLTEDDVREFDHNETLFYFQYKEVKHSVIWLLKRHNIIKNIGKCEYEIINEYEGSSLNQKILENRKNTEKEIRIIRKIRNLQEKNIVWGTKSLAKRVKLSEPETRYILRKLKLNGCLYRDYSQKRHYYTRRSKIELDFIYKLHPNYEDYIEMWL